MLTEQTDEARCPICKEWLEYTIVVAGEDPENGLDIRERILPDGAEHDVISDEILCSPECVKKWEESDA